MKIVPGRNIWSAALLAVSLALVAPASVMAWQSAAVPAPQREATTPQTNNAPQDPISQLNLSPEQRQQIRSIREGSKDERAAINRRLKETQIALDQALDSETPNEALIEQRAREAGEAQAASIRLRAVTESRIRRVLTPEQVKTLRELRAQAQQARREQRLENQANGARKPAATGRVLPNSGNGIAPGPGLRRNGLPRKPRR